MMAGLRMQDEIMASWQGDVDRPLVSILCIAYNHEAFIEEALRGFLSQKTDFPFEILIHDDASTDRTAAIIRDYQARYPRLIRQIYQTERQSRQNRRDASVLFSWCRGRYIVFCEGDNYWTDPQKLQMQFSYLEAHPEVAVSCHDAFAINAQGERIRDSELPDSYKRDFSARALVLSRGWGALRSGMIRNIPMCFDVPELNMVDDQDLFMLSLLGGHGGGHYHDDIGPAVYRCHSGGIWAALPEGRRLDAYLNTWFWMYCYYRRIADDVCARHYWGLYLQTICARARFRDLVRELIVGRLRLRLLKAAVVGVLARCGGLSGGPGTGPAPVRRDAGGGATPEGPQGLDMTADLRTQDEIMASWRGDAGRPLVSICCITYNHEAFIDEALRGFLIQETDFPFEILIHDDASTDRTAAIIRDYHARYPRLIRPVYQTENQYRQNRRATSVLFPLCRGRYIALCEGDDYWTDPRKLQIQSSYLEAHPDVAISGHDAFVVDEHGRVIETSKLSKEGKRDFSARDLVLSKGWVLTMSWMFRNVLEEFDVPERHMVRNGDTFLLALIGHYGGTHYHDDIGLAAYRVHSGGVWSLLSERDKEESRLNTWFWMYRYYCRIGDEASACHYWKLYLHAVCACARLRDFARAFVVSGLRLRAVKAAIGRIGVKSGCS